MAASDDPLIANGVDAITADYLLARAASPLAAPLRVPVEVVTHMIEDPAAVTCDEATRRYHRGSPVSPLIRGP